MGAGQDVLGIRLPGRLLRQVQGPHQPMVLHYRLRQPRQNTHLPHPQTRRTELRSTRGSLSGLTTGGFPEIQESSRATSSRVTCSGCSSVLR